MHIEVNYETKVNAANKIMPLQVIKYQSVLGSVEQAEKSFSVQLNGEQDIVIEVLRLIWELAFLYDGYFYIPKNYIVDGKEEKVEKLYFLTFYETGKIWESNGTTLAGAKKDFSEERLMKYYEFRNAYRESGKLLKSLVNSFYYLHSDAYERINVNHRLSLLLNMCDGFVINTIGETNNVKSNIEKVLKKNLNINLVKYGVSLLGIPEDKLYYALSQERNEIDHYAVKEESVSEYTLTIEGKTNNYLLWYFTYVLELALRVAFLKQTGFLCSEELKEFAMNQINDWVILGCDLKDDCRNPLNKRQQEWKRMGLEIR